MRIFGDAEDAGKHADGISVENWSRLIERNAADCTGGITADARQSQYIVELFRKPPSVLVDHNPSGAQKVSRARVVAQPFPEFEDDIGPGAGQGTHVRQAAHPALPVGDDRFDLRLLEHD